MQLNRIQLPPGWQWPAVVLLALGLIALTAGVYGGEYATTVAYGSTL